MKYFLVFNQAVTKDISKISCSPTLTVPVTLDEDIVGHKKLNLIATINHSGNLAMGHYAFSIKSTSSWHYCNDAVVIPSNETAVNNNTSIFFFLQKCVNLLMSTFDITDEVGFKKHTLGSPHPPSPPCYPVRRDILRSIGWGIGLRERGLFL